eukprot:COSAG02_NODE_13320_length_1410_cov_20.331345_2_plen_66_part_01
MLQLASLRLNDEGLRELGFKSGSRTKFSKLELDFRGVDVSHLNLTGLDLSEFDLSGGCNLSGANLS